MIAPPPQGNPYQLVDPSRPNAETVGCVVAWRYYRAMAADALPQFLQDMTSILEAPL